jgi:hypothetical protein
MNTKHTPAPWLVHATPNDPDITHEIANVCCIYVGEDSHANARLIAAAPELLEALKGLIAPFNGQMQDKDAYKKANAALKKAEGETT